MNVRVDDTGVALRPVSGATVSYGSTTAALSLSPGFVYNSPVVVQYVTSGFTLSLNGTSGKNTRAISFTQSGARGMTLILSKGTPVSFVTETLSPLTTLSLWTRTFLNPGTT